MDFKTISLIKHNKARVWMTMRDDLPKLAEMMDDVESITERERTETPAVYYVVNIWKSATKLPRVIVQWLNSEYFTWTDKAEWNNNSYECNWTIELNYFRDSIKCHGTTTFEPAMGGNGTRVTFNGKLEWDKDKLTGITGVFGDAVLAMAEGIIQNVIQKNFRKVTETIAKHLDSN